MDMFADAIRIDFGSNASIEERLRNLREEGLAERQQPLLEEDSGNRSPTDKEKIAYVKRLCLAQLAYGQCTVDAEESSIDAAVVLGLDTPLLDIGPKSTHVNFNGDIDHLESARDIMLSKLKDVAYLQEHTVKHGGDFTKLDIDAACALLDEIEKEPLPYGWLLQDLFYIGLSTFGAIAAFFGSYADMLIVFVISLFNLGLKRVVKRYPTVLLPLDSFLVSLLTGMLTCGAFKISSWHDDLCSIPIVFLSPLIVYLPGSDLVYGSYEILHNNIIVGASRMTSALVKCMILAMGLTCGWYIVGYGFMTDKGDYQGANASFVPYEKCAPFTKPMNVGPWWVVFSGWNLVLLFPALGGLQVKARDIFWIYATAYASLLAFGALNFAIPSDHALSEFIVNLLGMFVATNLVCLREYIQGDPALPGLIPILLILAPGSSVLIDVLTVMQSSAGVSGNSSADVVTYLFLLGVSYCLGMYIALSYWRPIIRSGRLGTNFKDPALILSMLKGDNYFM